MKLLVALVAIYLVYLLSVNRIRGPYSAYYELLPGRVYPRQMVGMFLTYVLLMTGIAIGLMRSFRSRFDEGKVVMSVVWFALILGPIMAHLYCPKLSFYYSKNEAEVFRENVEMTNTAKNVGRVTYQTTMIPLYKDKARTQRIGKFYSSAEIFGNQTDELHQVLQYVTYAFDGSDRDFPYGTLVMSIAMMNDVHDIFPPDQVYEGSVITGTGSFTGASGVVEVDVRGPDRAVTVTM